MRMKRVIRREMSDDNGGEGFMIAIFGGQGEGLVGRVVVCCCCVYCGQTDKSRDILHAGFGQSAGTSSPAAAAAATALARFPDTLPDLQELPHPSSGLLGGLVGHGG